MRASNADVHFHSTLCLTPIIARSVVRPSLMVRVSWRRVIGKHQRRTPTNSGVCSTFTAVIIYKACWCVGGCMAQSIRVESYIPQHVSDELERVADNRSEFIREAIKEKLDKEGRVNE